MFARPLKFAALALMAICCASCGAGAATEPAPGKTTVKPARRVKLKFADDVRAVARSENKFAFDLYGRLREAQGNLFYSPASISTALAMVYAGARGETRLQMARALHFDLPDERLLAAFAAFGQSLNSGDEHYQLSMANRLWGQRTYSFRPAYLELTRDRFSAELAPLDFARSGEARQTINRWVEQQTHDKITDLIAPGVLSAVTRLVLTNAIYFKGAWEHEFWENATETAPFHVSRQQDVRSPLMHQVEDLPYAETDLAQIVALPYAGGDLSLVVLLPKAIDGFERLEAELTAENVERWTSDLRERKVQLWLPKFKTTSEFSLGETLDSLGMTLAFSEQADLSGISASKDLFISAVLHKSYIDVNELGTEAAAATAAKFEGAAEDSERQQPVVFRADHPFVYLIRVRRSGAILFLGRLLQPG